ncbi:MAG: hypothetical protein JNM10_05415 [Planctomycetia bacterium]|nr:hypothetical protein [Planctomycetia bacterium]
MTDRNTRFQLIAEDRNLHDLASALVRRQLAETESPVVLSTAVRLTHGCRPEALRQLVDRSSADHDVVLVVVDADGEGHGFPRRPTHRQKSGALQKLISGSGRGNVHVFAASPCAEGWLLSMGPAIGLAISAVLGVEFKPPPHWPTPASERDAKLALSDLLSSAIQGDHLPRLGFEFAAEIVAGADLSTLTNRSLTDFLVATRRLMNAD